MPHARQRGCRTPSGFPRSRMRRRFATGSIPVELRDLKDAFARGDIPAALDLAPEWLADRLAMPVGTPEECIEQLTERVLPLGYNHISFLPTSPDGIRKLTGREVPGLPSIVEQIQLYHERVVPALKATHARTQTAAIDAGSEMRTGTSL